jgi:uncharacterized membrane protein
MTTPATEPTVNDRWLAALCYASIAVIVPILRPRRSGFLARHCRQGFALLFAEVVLLLVLIAIERTLGRIPVLGLLLSILLYLAYFLTFLAVSVIGFTRAIAGEEWRLPFLDDFADRVPIHATDESSTDAPGM